MNGVVLGSTRTGTRVWEPFNLSNMFSQLLDTVDMDIVFTRKKRIDANESDHPARFALHFPPSHAIFLPLHLTSRVHGAGWTSIIELMSPTSRSYLDIHEKDPTGKRRGNVL